MLWFIILFVSVLNSNCYSDYGEPCRGADECIDHRLTCDNYGRDSLGTCVCVRFYEWMNDSCVQIFNASTIMNLTINELNATILHLETTLSNYNEYVFKIQVAAGLFVMSMCGLSIVVVMFYCHYVRKSDHKLKTEVKMLNKPRMSTSAKV